MKTALFIVDMQNDFCSPSGSLFVPGAVEDVERLCRLIDKRKEEIDKIFLTEDQHHVIDIAHPYYWRNAKGAHPAPFTEITWWDVLTGAWTPFGNKDEVINYLRKLIETGEYRHMIWPEHCIMGSEGAALVPILMEAVNRWARQGRYCEVIEKGINPSTEYFGAFRANVPVENAPDTAFNVKLKDRLVEFDTIWLAGEAKSHCVANTVKQLFEYPDIIRKLLILEDCTSNIPGCEALALSIYEKAAELGAKFTTSDKLL